MEMEEGVEAVDIKGKMIEIGPRTCGITIRHGLGIYSRSTTSSRYREKAG
jgi:hypothetical protein